MLETMRALIDIDMYVGVFDKKGVAVYLYPETGEADGIRLGKRFEDSTGKLDKVLATGKPMHNRIPSGKFGFELEGNLIPVMDGDEIVGCMTATYLPINRKFMEAQQIALQSIYGMILSVNAHNDKCVEIYQSYTLGLSEISIVKFSDFCKNSAQMFHADDREKYLTLTELSTLKHRLTTDHSTSCECRLCTSQIHYRWVEIMISRVGDPNDVNDEGNYLYMVRDIDARKSAEELYNKKNQQLIQQLECANQALFTKGISDEMTNLYNRKGLEYFKEEVFNKSQQGDNMLLVCVADVDSLKYINDHFGHESGDRAICVLGDILREETAKGSICARTGGDEFVVLASWSPDEEDPHKAIERIQKRMKQYNLESNLPYHVQASLGFFIGKPEPGKTLNDYIRSADDCMYREKYNNKELSPELKEIDTRLLHCGKPKVLLADPDIDRCVFDLQYAVLEANNEAEFMEIWRREKALDLVILDIDHPKLNGFGLLKKLRQTDGIRKQALILTSKSGNADFAAREYATEISALFHKPVEPIFFQMRVAYYIRLHAECNQMKALIEEKDRILSIQLRKLEEQAACLKSADRWQE